MDEPAELDQAIVLNDGPEPTPNIQRPPRIWPVFVAYLLTFGALILCQLVAISFLFVWLIAHGANLEQLQTQLHALLLTPLVFLVLGSLSQIVVACCAFKSARLSPVQTRQSLGFLPSGLSAIGYAIVLAGLAFPILLGTGIEYFLRASKRMNRERMIYPGWEQKRWEQKRPPSLSPLQGAFRAAFRPALQGGSCANGGHPFRSPVYRASRRSALAMLPLRRLKPNTEKPGKPGSRELRGLPC
jgi:hypothetical protein